MIILLGGHIFTRTCILLCIVSLFFLFSPNLHFTLPQTEQKKYPLLKLQSSVSSNFSSDKTHIIQMIQERLAEILHLQKKLFINSQKKFVEFNFVKKELQFKASFEYFQKFVTQLKRLPQSKNKNQDNEFYLTLFFGRHQYKDFLHVIFASKQKLFFQHRYLLEVPNLKKLHEKLDRKLRQVLCQKKCHLLQLNVRPPKSSIYVNDIFMGSSPIKLTTLPPGSYKLEILKDAYQKYEATIDIPKIKIKKISLKKIESFASLLIKTKPSGANIYIDVVYEGRSPFLLKKLRRGQHKLRIVKQGFDTYEHFFHVKEQELLQFNINLVVSKSTSLSDFFWGEAFKSQYLYIASFTASFIFFSTGVYFSIEAANTRERLLVVLSGSTSDHYTSKELQNIEFSKMKASNQEILSISFYALGGLFFGTGIYFLIKNLHMGNFFTRDNFRSFFWFKGNFMTWNTGYTYHF